MAVVPGRYLWDGDARTNSLVLRERMYGYELGRCSGSTSGWTVLLESGKRTGKYGRPYLWPDVDTAMAHLLGLLDIDPRDVS